MDVNQFREFAKSAVDFVADYLENIRDRPVLPSVEPGYLHKLVPDEVPEQPEQWQEVMKDMERVILPGVTHWQSPNFHAYYPTATSFPSIVGEMIASGLGIIGFSWICSPACTELEVVLMDWLGKFLDLPASFLNCSEGPGGGVIQGSASEAILVAILAAREQTVRRVKLEHPEMSESEIRGKLVSYSSDQSNSCVEKAGLLAAVPIRLIKADDNGSLRGEELEKTVLTDIENGLIPIICIATFGTTGTCAYDHMDELGPICKKYNIWLHIDAAYAGAALCCPEYRPLMSGIDWADSFNFNLHKWMMVNFDCCAMWLKNADTLVEAFSVDRIYLNHQFQGQSKAPDYRHWQIPLGRRFRALKVWIVLRTIGAENIRNNIRKHIHLAELFENYVKMDDRFEIVSARSMGLVCFRLKGDCSLTRQLLEKITERKQIYMIQAKCNEKLMMRFVVAGLDPNEKDIEFAWNEIVGQTCELLQPRKLAVDDSVIDKVANNFATILTTASHQEKLK
ncbi:3,4-dihydroxyphenylacetaldehyde synthase 2-like [Bradysia coprophila]|uniref:3,4-dihydroxyphenylacetaldehyde synthase 2-like n=1 Tax=Bradysia coprophila TaxID=38358 RepID=UPI00187D9150|nr:3,4-dihydroxyphenylacetaldehyde synthase 2-like [Bradysia coprophila]XP_037033325.1 3,4-dihydroxyphenylacetaldehyde synthase 2-like [Bradysia coprophila]XP_037033326.1 3,4-dihydroxyphenylacetaldehyde synthase 2-like [Bradysia coprophila]